MNTRNQSIIDNMFSDDYIETGGDDGGRSTNQHARPRGPHGEDDHQLSALQLPGGRFVNEIERKRELGYRLVSHNDVTPWEPSNRRQKAKLSRGSRNPEY